MPSKLLDGYRFFFYSNERNEPAHMHVLFTANAEQRSRWEIVPTGGGVWWPDLDEGIELQPLLDMQRLY